MAEAALPEPDALADALLGLYHASPALPFGGRDLWQVERRAGEELQAEDAIWLSSALHELAAAANQGSEDGRPRREKS